MLDTKNPPSDPQKTYFFEKIEISGKFDVPEKSRFFGGQRGVRDPQTPQMVLKYIGESGFIIFLVEKGPFQ